MPEAVWPCWLSASRARPLSTSGLQAPAPPPAATARAPPWHRGAPAPLASAHTACRPITRPTKLTRAAKLSMKARSQSTVTSAGGAISKSHRGRLPLELADRRDHADKHARQQQITQHHRQQVRHQAAQHDQGKCPMALTSRAAAQRPRPSRRRPQPTTAMEAAIISELTMIIDQHGGNVGSHGCAGGRCGRGGGSAQHKPSSLRTRETARCANPQAPWRQAGTIRPFRPQGTKGTAQCSCAGSPRRRHCR